MTFFARLVAWVVLFAASAAGAAERVVTDHADSRLVVERAGLAPGETTWFALAQTLQPGWHVYWRNPGDSGLPLELQWTLPEGFEAGEILYPTPEHFPIGPFANFGHYGAPAFLVPVSVPADAVPGETVTIALNATWLICEEICVPEEGSFSLSLPIERSPAIDPQGAQLIAKAREALPEAYQGEARFSAAEGRRILLALDAPEGDPATAYFFPYTNGLTEPAAPQTVGLADGRLTLSMPAGVAYRPDSLESLSGVLALEDARGEWRGYALTATPGEVAPPPEATAAVAGPGATGAVSGPGAPESAPGLALLLVMAFFGGALLNLMPCVFPVIFIKAASLIKGAHTSPREARTHGLFYAAGVVATFAALGGLLLTLRAGGEALGWGFHLQSPVVVILSAYVLFLVGLHLAGLYSVGESLQGTGSGLAERGGHTGAFFTGMLAVFVAAPCIGPLLAAPVGAAVMLPPVEGMALFVTMALGLAAPYLAISFLPGLARKLPRPGPWMTTFKQALAFPVFGGAAFFLWVLAQQAGADGLARALVGALLLAFAAWLFEKSKSMRGRALAAKAAAVAVLVAAVAPVAGLRLVETAQAESAGGYGGVETHSYDRAAIEAFRAEGRPVFIDFTAAWCVTCQFNKATVLSRRAIAAAFEAENGVLIVADWTRRDPEITAALAEFGANGVPLYVVYPPGGAPQVLPLPLTEGAVIKALSTPQSTARRTSS